MPKKWDMANRRRGHAPMEVSENIPMTERQRQAAYASLRTRELEKEVQRIEAEESTEPTST